MTLDYLIEICGQFADDELSQKLSIREELSLGRLFFLSGIQDAASAICLRRARLLSEQITDERGSIDPDRLKKWIDLFQEKGALFSPFQEESFQKMTLRCLRAFLKPEMARLLNRFHYPLDSSFAEKMVRYALGVPEEKKLSEAHVRRAVLSACLTPLRQTVGSCFATAPAILVQRDAPDLLLKDLYEILYTGRVKRVSQGVEYTVPTSFTTGVGDLRKDLLKVKTSVFSPGLIKALMAIGFFSREDSIEECAHRLSLEIKKRKGLKRLSMEELIHALCLEKSSLSEEDFIKASQAEKAQATQFQRGILGFSSAESNLLKRFHTFEKKKQLALETFKAQVNHPLLKVWEFTLAGFSEAKKEVSQWNFAVSLGLSHEEKGGIGEVLFKRVQEKVEETNLLITQHQREYESALDQLRSVESLMRNVSSEQEGRRLRAEYQAKAQHMRSCQEMREQFYEKGTHESGLFTFLVQQYYERFADAFQEVYDPQMHETAAEMYEDSPAGFRLAYREGRSDPSAWTLITSAQEYIQCLERFFNQTELAIVQLCDWEGSREAIAELTSLVLHHIQTKEFLETALARMIKAHRMLAKGKQPITSAEKKPWAYTSGGTLSNLLQMYYGRQGDFSIEERWVESPSDLLIFLLDTLKNLPPSLLNPYVKGEKTGMLMHSPSHAFVLLPQWMQEGWQGNEFTYTWVRDQVVEKGKEFYSKVALSAQEQTYLYQQLKSAIPLHPFTARGSISSDDFYEILISLLKSRKQREEVDAFLYQSLPLISKESLVLELSAVLQQLFPTQPLDEAIDPLFSFKDPFVTAFFFREIVKSCCIVISKTLAFSFDLQEAIYKAMQEKKLAPPTPFLFADTNWPRNYFAFLVSPATFELELWRVSRFYQTGYPMHNWQHYLNGQEKKSWSIFVNPYEYS